MPNTKPSDLQVVQPAALDYGLAVAYVEALTGEPADAAVLDLRACHDTDNTAPAQNRRGTLPDLWPWIEQHNRAGYGIFCLVQQSDGAGRSKEHITAGRAAWVDLDAPDSEQQYEAAARSSPPPSFAVRTSPGKFHLYWRLAPGASLDLVDSVNARLVTRFNGDPAARDRARVLRLPGTLHGKGEPSLVTCHRLDGFDQPVQVEALDKALVGVLPAGGGAGERRGLGDPALAAPSLELAARAMSAINPNDLDRDTWIRTLAAFKQALWSYLPPDAVDGWLMNWCGRYEADNPAENRKQIASIRKTSAGWPALVQMVPALRAEMSFGAQPIVQASVSLAQQTVPAKPPGQSVLTYDLPNGAATTGAPSHLDVVRQCDDWRLPVAHDVFADRLMVTGPMPGERSERGGTHPRPLTDRDYTIVRMQFNGLGLKPGSEALREGLDFYARMNRYDPVTDWLDGLQWDEVPRLDGWLSRYLGCADDEWSRIAGAKFLISMVARAYSPGHKVDTALVLEGAQGVGKSTALRTLAGDAHFGDQLPNLSDKEGLAYIQGLWLVEISELAAMRRGEVEDIKTFIAARFDRYRAPYGRLVDEHPRRCVFAATTNESTYLKDPTGDRRWWPVTCGTIDNTALAADRAQLFGEAVARYRAGEAWWLDPAQNALALVEQAKRRKVSAWFASVAAVCAEAEAHDTAEQRRVTMSSVFLRAKLPISDLGNPRYTVPLAGDLRALGWTQDRTSTERHYVKTV